MNRSIITASLVLTLTASAAPSLAQEAFNGGSGTDNDMDFKFKMLRMALAALDHAAAAGEVDAPPFDTAWFSGKDGGRVLALGGLEQTLALGGLEQTLAFDGVIAWSEYGEVECLAPAHPSYDDVLGWFHDQKSAKGSRRSFTPIVADDGASMGSGIVCIAYDGDAPIAIARIGVSLDQSIMLESTKLGS